MLQRLVYVVTTIQRKQNKIKDEWKLNVQGQRKWLWPVVTGSVFKFQHSPPSIPLKANSSKLHTSSLSFRVGRLNDVCSLTILVIFQHKTHFEIVSICTVMLGCSVSTQDNINYRTKSCAVNRHCCRIVLCVCRNQIITLKKPI